LQHLLWLGLLAIMVALGTPARAQQALPAPRGHVSDYAGVLGPNAARIDAGLRRFERDSGHQVFVLTVKTTGPDKSVEAYAEATFRQWQLGRKGIDDGVLLLIASDDRRLRIEVGYGLEGDLTDARAARIIRDKIAPNLKQGDFVAGVEAGVLAIMRVTGPQAAGAAAAIMAELPGPAAGGAAGAGAAAAAAPGDPMTTLYTLLIVLAVALLCFGLSLFGGALGLAAVALTTLVLPVWIRNCWQTWLFGTVVLLTWTLLRWCLIRANVKRYHLPTSTNPTQTWIDYLFLGAPSFGLTRPPSPDEYARKPMFVRREGNDGRRRERSDDDDSGWFSFGSGGGSSGSSSSSDSGSSSGGGGRSGGGGASGSW
jgi:uncharacterized protein